MTEAKNARSSLALAISPAVLIGLENIVMPRCCRVNKGVVNP